MPFEENDREAEGWNLRLHQFPFSVSSPPQRLPDPFRLLVPLPNGDCCLLNLLRYLREVHFPLESHPMIISSQADTIILYQYLAFCLSVGDESRNVIERLFLEGINS